MAQREMRNRLDRPVDEASDHLIGPADAEITLVEYGSYACPHCRAANEQHYQASAWDAVFPVAVAVGLAGMLY